MKKNILTFLYLGLISSVFAQVSGYRGKRFLVEVQPTFSFNWLKTIFRAEDPIFRISPGIHAEYAISRSGSMALDYRFNSHKQYLAFPYMLSRDSTVEVKFTETTVTENTLMLNYRHYYSKANHYWGLAPVGLFVGFGVAHYFGVNADTKSSPLTYESPKGVRNTFIRLEVGSRTVIFNKVTFNYSVSCGLLPNLTEEVYVSDGNDYKLVEINQYNKMIMNTSLVFVNRFNANIGFGVFLF